MAHHGEMLCKELPFKRYHWFYACCIALIYAAPSSTQWLTTLLNKFPSFRYMGALPLCPTLKVKIWTYRLSITFLILA